MEINGKPKTVVVAEGMRGMDERDKIAEQRRLERELKRKEKAEAEATEKLKAVELEKKKIERLTKAIAKSRQKEEEEKKKAKEESGEAEKKEKEKKTNSEATPKPKLTPEQVTSVHSSGCVLLICHIDSCSSVIYVHVGHRKFAEATIGLGS